MNTSEIFKSWYNSQPKSIQPYIRQQIINVLGWTPAQFYNSMTRREITKAEQFMINQLMNEDIFQVEFEPLTILKA